MKNFYRIDLAKFELKADFVKCQNGLIKKNLATKKISISYIKQRNNFLLTILLNLRAQFLIDSIKKC